VSEEASTLKIHLGEGFFTKKIFNSVWKKNISYLSLGLPGYRGPEQGDWK